MATQVDYEKVRGIIKQEITELREVVVSKDEFANRARRVDIRELILGFLIIIALGERAFGIIKALGFLG